jgi:glycerol kinase
MQKDARTELSNLKVDGGACVNDDLMQFQADLLGSTISRPKVAETTALGAAYLAGLAVGYWENLEDVTRNWALDKTFQPTGQADCEQHYAMWQRAVERSLAWDAPPDD